MNPAVWLTWSRELALFLLPTAAFFLAAMVGNYRLRSGIGRRWITMTYFVVAFAGLLGLAAGTAYLSRLSVQVAESLQKRHEMAALKPDWGAGWPPEKRTQYSVMLARIAFERHGESRAYFDAQGKLTPYVPNAEDHGRRAYHLYLVEQMKQRTWIYAAATACFLALFPLGIAAGRTRFAAWFYRLGERAVETGK